MQERYIVTADLGCSRIAVAVAHTIGENTNVIYYRETPSDGIRESCVYNPTKAAEALKSALSLAEKELDIKIHQLVVGLPRYQIQQEISKAEIKRTDPESCITKDEILTLKEMALENYPNPDPDRLDIYGAVIQSFTADDIIQAKEDDVIGIISEKLIGNYKIFIGSAKAKRNIDKMLNMAEVAAADKMFIPHKTAKAVLSEEEMENGCGLVEMGAGVTSVSIYKGGILRYYAAIPFGGRNTTLDIKYEGGFKESLAENIKLGYGACLPEKLQNMSEKVLQINDSETGTYELFKVKYLSEIITARTSEIIDAILYHIQDSGLKEQLRSGIVLTGGAANLANVSKLFNEMSGYRVRIGYPRLKNITTSCPEIRETSAAATVGMLLSCIRNKNLNCVEEIVPEQPQNNGEQSEGQQGYSETGKLNLDFEEVPVDNTGKGGLFTKPIVIWHRLENKLSNNIDRLDLTMGNLFEEQKEKK